MRTLRRLAVALLLAGAAAQAGDWVPVSPGLEYRRIQQDGMDAHAVRVDLDDRTLEVVASAARERGLTVSEFAAGRGAVVAINADYFDTSLDPVGLAMGDGEV
jgi:exopolysaccharide biosynthesis protein